MADTASIGRCLGAGVIAMMSVIPALLGAYYLEASVGQIAPLLVGCALVVVAAVLAL